MPTIPQIRGMLLEEALLYLLRTSGYQTIETAGSDPTLHLGTAGLEVKGRGSVHQIDAIADYIVAHPFSHPQRLLVEAKCYASNYPVGIEKIRNAVGVLKDVEEFWVSRGKNGPFKKRYHYQYAFFSASEYTAGAEAYAYAQDIYLIPLARSQFIKSLISAIRQVTPQAFGVTPPRYSINLDLSHLRWDIRNAIRDGSYDNPGSTVDSPRARNILTRFCRECRRINEAVLAMIDRQIPVFLAPAPDVNLAELENEYQVRIYWDEEGWYLREITGRILFSFDLPPNLFELYAEEGMLSRDRALDLKADFFSVIQAVITVNEQIRLITFKLDREWLYNLRQQTRRLSDLPSKE